MDKDFPNFLRVPVLTKEEKQKKLIEDKRKYLITRNRRYKKLHEKGLFKLKEELLDIQYHAQNKKLPDEMVNFRFYRAIKTLFIDISPAVDTFSEVTHRKPLSIYDEQVVSILNLMSEMEKASGLGNNNKLNKLSENYIRGLIVEGLIIYGMPRDPAIEVCAKWMEKGKSTIRTANEAIRNHHDKIRASGKFDKYHFPLFLKFQRALPIVIHNLKKGENSFPNDLHVTAAHSYSKFLNALENVDGAKSEYEAFLKFLNKYDEE